MNRTNFHLVVTGGQHPERGRRQRRAAAIAGEQTGDPGPERGAARVHQLDHAAHSHAERLRPFIADTSLLIDEALRAGRRVLFEGARPHDVLEVLR